jgi:amino acid transporter
MSDEKGLAHGAIGVVESAIMGIAGTAPAYSIAVTTAAIVAAVGMLSVGSILFCGLIMFGMMLAFVNLNKMSPDAGASFAWVKEVFGPTWGFFAGWGLIVASVVFMVSATIPAATSTLLILSPDKVESTGWLKGIKQASYAQIVFTIIETVIIFALIIAAFIEYGANPAHAPSWDWVSPFSFTPATFATGALIAVFFYWGWDVTMNLGEETVDGKPQPAGRGAFWAMVNLILFFIIMLIVVLIVLTDAEIEAANTNVLYAIAEKLFPHPWGYLAVLSTILSTIGTIETQILCFTRSMFSMSRAKMFHPNWAKIHPQWQTPWFATLGIWVMGLGLLFMSSYLPTVSKILESSILAIGLQICFYMSLAGLASVWYYRGMLKGSMKDALTHVIWPGLATAFMIFIGVYGALEFDQLTMLVGVGGLALGFLPLVLGHLRNRKAE